MTALAGAYPWAFVVVVGLVLIFLFSVVWLVLSKKGKDDEVVIRLFPKPEITIGRVSSRVSSRAGGRVSSRVGSGQVRAARSGSR